MMENIERLMNKPVQYLKGVGSARAALFQKLGIFTIGDVINYFPRDYEDRSALKRIAQLEDGDQCSFEGIIVSKVVETRPRKGLLISRVSIRDETGMINAVWFNKAYLKASFKIDDSFIFYGKISRNRSFEVSSPIYERSDAGEPKNTLRIMPIYPSTGNLSQNIIRSAIRSSLSLVSGSLDETLPQWLRNKYGLSDIDYSIENIHFPSSDEAFKKARYRLVFEELLFLQLGLFLIKKSMEVKDRGLVFGAREEVRKFMATLPFKLTKAQTKVFEEIELEMDNGNVMNRLIQGDVGSGKTIIALISIYKAVRSGYQAAMMVPTEILAEQHYSTITSLLEGSGIKTAVLKGGMPAKTKQSVLDEIRNGSINIVIGTHALLEDNVIFERLGLVVTDEQHRFGVRQRAALSRKGDNPDILVMTATPIPRTLALILYGDLDISVIDELPPGRRPVVTYTVNESMRSRIDNFIRKNVSDGRQVYIVCPLVEESDEVQAKSASELAKHIAEQEFRDLKVGLIHGKMKSKDKDAIMGSFVKGETDILVSTTVIEVGVNVPNASLMVVENAERFGLAQLHQLRGRVGRGVHQSYCILYNESRSEISMERMKIMEKTTDGFLISEKDLELRGPGDFFGTMQHGLPNLKIANLYKDIDILKKAQEAANEIMTKAGMPEKDENKILMKKVKEKFFEKLGSLSMN